MFLTATSAHVNYTNPYSWPRKTVCRHVCFKITPLRPHTHSLTLYHICCYIFFLVLYPCVSLLLSPPISVSLSLLLLCVLAKAVSMYTYTHAYIFVGFSETVYNRLPDTFRLSTRQTGTDTGFTGVCCHFSVSYGL